MRADIKLYNQDCMEALVKMKDNEFDLAITSPPYNLGNNHHTGNIRHSPYKDDIPEDEYQNWQKDVLQQVYRVLKVGGSLFYNHKNRIRQGKQITPYSWILKTSFTIKQELIWFNGSQNFDKCRFYPMTERIYWLSKTPSTKFYNNINHHDLFDWKAVGTGKKHKRAYPLEMVKDILKCFPKGSVLDPFLGSGTTAVACYDMGFSLTGYEIDKDYYEAAVKRLERHKAQGQLF